MPINWLSALSSLGTRRSCPHEALIRKSGSCLHMSRIAWRTTTYDLGS
jgi:hypothetical protein